MMAYTGRLSLKGVPFSGFRYMKDHERVGISPDEFYGFRKLRKRYIFVTDSYFKIVHLQQ